MPWQNLNNCLSFTEVFGTTRKKLSAANCSEVIIYNLGSAGLIVADNNRTATGETFTVAPSASFTFRGVTSSDSVSANFASAPGVVSYRTQMYSDLPFNGY